MSPVVPVKVRSASRLALSKKVAKVANSAKNIITESTVVMMKSEV